jgi:hypothetical protein
MPQTKVVLRLLTMLVIAATAYTSLSSNSAGILGASGCSCHGSSNGGTLLALTGLPSAGYTAGTTYNLSFTVTSSGFAKAGFSLECSAGSWSSSNSDVTLSAGADPNQITHNGPKTMTGTSATWNFSWTAPASGSGAVTFTYAGNAVNGNGQATMDSWNNGTLIVADANAIAPTITSGPNASNITFTTADISAQVNPNNASCSTELEYGTSTAYGNTITMTPNNITGNTAQTQSASMSNLAPGTTYHYRIKATSVNGSTLSNDATFATPNFPAAINNVDIANYFTVLQQGSQYVIIASGKTMNACTILTSSGQVMQQHLANKQQSIQLSLQDLPTGFYVMHVQFSDGSTGTRSFTKL